MSKKVSPFKNVPLRQAGSSLLMRRMMIVMDTYVFWLMTLLAIGILAMTEWAQVLFETPPQPVLLSIVFVGVAIITIIRIAQGKHQLENYDLGIMGERFVAERLNELIAHGYRVIHDVPLKHMNIDHVLIGSGGIFTIETKVARKTVGEKSEIIHSKSGAFMNGKKRWMGKVLWQAKKEAEYLKDILSANRQYCPHIQPIVVYPTWFVKDDCKGDIWIMNDRYLVKKIQMLPKSLSPDEIGLFSRKIKYYVREKIGRLDYK